MSEINSTDRLIHCAEQLGGILQQLAEIRARELDMIADAAADAVEGVLVEGVGYGVDLSGQPIRTH